MRVVECVPNFSEGRDEKVIEQIAEAIRGVEGVRLLDVDPGRSTNRTVMTFVGEPDAVVEAAYRSIARAADLIDMRKHQGAHPRLGATDVCPFVPVAGISMEDCAELARRLGKRVGESLGIPVYLYAEAATCPERRNLADVRQGEYEGLSERMRNGFKPDFGPPDFNPASGATVIGARPFLIAYNVNLNTRSRKLAHEIALTIREAGRSKRDEQGNIVRDASGKAVKQPGTLKSCKAVGWYVEEYKQAQVSINLVDYTVTSLHQAFDEVERQAALIGLRVTGSEIVGLVPLAPLLSAGRHYLRRQGRSAGVSERELVETAALSLGLSDISQFDPDKKIIEYCIRPAEKLLRQLPVTAFVEELASDSPAPGGGSVAALSGCLSAALLSMVANLTFAKKGMEERRSEMEEIACRAQELTDRLLRAVDQDTQAFNKIAEARKLPSDTDEKAREREAAVEAANQGATAVPLSVLESAAQVVDLCQRLAERGNPATLSDVGAAGTAARACAEAAYYNVLINLQAVRTESFVAEAGQKSRSAVESVRERCDALHRTMVAKLNGSR